MIKRALALAALAIATIAAVIVPTGAQAAHGGFHVSGTQLLDANGVPFVARGTSLPHVWFGQQFGMFSDAAELGANAVRVVLGSGHQWGPSDATDIRMVVDECKRLEMVCMLEVHDATGYEDPFGQTIASIVDVVEDYWADPAMGIADELAGEEAYVLVNIANEHRGNTNAQEWGDETSTAIQLMRDAGYEHTLVVDAPNWGQDWSGTMLDQATDVAAADTLGNTLFSIHMYEVYGSPQTVTDYFDGFDALGLPLVVGEFGWQHQNPPQPVAWETVMAEAQARGIGWFGWSWSGNSGDADYLDQVTNFDPNQLTRWGTDLFLGQNGIQATAVCATVYDCEPPVEDTESPTAPGQPDVVDVTSTSAELNWAASTDNVGVAAYDVYLDGALADTVGGTSATLGGLSPETTYTATVVARDTAGNESDASPPATFTSEQGPPVGTCAVDFGISEWGDGNGGFTTHITVQNTGAEPIDGWVLEFDLTGSASLTHGWSANWSQDGQTVTATPLDWNQVLGQTGIGFNGTAYGGEPANVTLNGQRCE